MEKQYNKWINETLEKEFFTVSANLDRRTGVRMVIFPFFRSQWQTGKCKKRGS